MTYQRNCSNCNQIIEYQNKRSWYNAKKRNSNCKKCAIENIRKTLLKKVEDGTYKKNIRPKNQFVNYTHFRNCPVCNREMGYTRKDIMINSEKKKTICNSCSTYKYKKNFKNIINSEHVKQMRATKAGYESFAEYEREYPKKKMYKNEVWRLTYKQPLESLENFHLRGKCGVEGAWQIDHIKSIDWGYRNGVAAEEIARFSNLRMIPWKENLLKSSK